MKYIYLIKFIAIAVSMFMATTTWAQNTCTSITEGRWTSASTWSCTGGYTTPSGDFAGTINITYKVSLANDEVVEITGKTVIVLSGTTPGATRKDLDNIGILDFGTGGKQILKLTDRYSYIDIGNTINRLEGNSQNSELCFGTYPNQYCCPGPWKGEGTNLVNGPRTISSFTDSYCGVANALPVTLLSFTAKPEADRVQVAWATTSEQNAARFVVERSADLGEYMSVGQVAAKGTSDGRQNYGLTDMQPLPGVNYYRLRQIDRNGDSQTFKPVSAIVNSDEIVAAVYPNPADANRIHLRLRNADNAVVRLLTLAGQPVEGKLERMLDEADLVLQHPLQAGMYLLEVQTNGQKRISKVLIR